MRIPLKNLISVWLLLLAANFSSDVLAANASFPYFSCSLSSDDIAGGPVDIVLREGEANGPISVKVGNNYYVEFSVYEYQLFVSLLRSGTDESLLKNTFAGLEFTGEMVVRSGIFPDLSSIQVLCAASSQLR